MKLIYGSFVFIVLLISTGFVFSTSSNIDSERSSRFQTNFSSQDTSKKEEIDPIYSIVEQPARFEGGMNKFYEYIAESLNYPDSAREKGIDGRVFIQFVVDKDGSIIDTKVVKGVDTKLDAEALRVIQNSPKWIPAVQRGKNVKVRMNIPIVFTLDKNETKEDKKTKKGKSKRKG